ncbi:MAG: sugar phosphate nucleotidyltransferase [Hyphomonadaceae bacterium]
MGSETITIYPAIMSGGAGTRLWPLSSEARPKQFHTLAGDKSLLQQTVERLGGETGGVRFMPPIILGNASQADLILAQLAEIGVEPTAVILEPEGRNTAATAAIAARHVHEIDPDALVFLAPADGFISDAERFRALAARAATVAGERIVTFGIVPERPETGYGYIRAGAPVADGVMAIDSFTEKPDAETARRYLDAGGYYWNGGMFLFSPAVMLEEFDSAPDIRDASLAALAAADRDGLKITLGEAFLGIRSAPIDKAVMEATTKGAVVPCDIGWADIGSWFELWRMNADGPDANVVHGLAVLDDSEGTLVRADDGVVVAAAGLKDMVVVAVPGAVLIVPRERSQDVKDLRKAALDLAAANRKSGQ